MDRRKKAPCNLELAHLPFMMRFAKLSVPDAVSPKADQLLSPKFKIGGVGSNNGQGLGG